MEFGIAPYDALTGASVPPDKAKAVVLELEKEMLDRLATKQDLLLLKQDLLVLQQQMEARLTLRMGAMIAAAVTVLVALQKLI